MSPKEEADSEDLWQCGSCGKEFDSYEVALFHEENECKEAQGRGDAGAPPSKKSETHFPKSEVAARTNSRFFQVETDWAKPS